MIPFYTRFTELAARETRCIHVINDGDWLPVGGYGFIELYCEDPDCDCRRVVLQVTTDKPPYTVLATINYGWESVEFYTRWMHGDQQAGCEIKEACLDPLNIQSQYADDLLDFFRTQLMTDAAYVARLARHYEMFKATQRKPAESVSQPSPATSEKPAAPVAPAMTVASILWQLQRVPEQTDFAPYERALRAALEQREAITPELIAAIDRVSADPARYLKDDEDCLHLFALYLLAQFRETRALDAFVRFFSLPGEQSLDLTGDLVTENGAAVLASVCGGDPEPLLRLLHDESVNPFVRGQAIFALAVQALWGERPRAAVVEELRRLFHTLPKPGNDYVWAELTSLVSDFNAPELAPEARRAFAEELVDESVLDLDSFETDMRERVENYDYFRERNTPIDAVNECHSWCCFRDENAEADGLEDDDIDDEDFPDDAICLPPEEPAAYIPSPKPMPYIAPPSVGRNDPCPCGSGKKYKKCCGK